MTIKGIATNLFGWIDGYNRNRTDWNYASLLKDCISTGIYALEPINPTIAELEYYNGKIDIPSCYIGLDVHRNWADMSSEDRILPVASKLAEIGGTLVVVNADPKDGWGKKSPKNEDDLKRQGENLTRLSEKLNSLGLKTCMHNHAETKEGTEGDLRSVIHYASAAVGLCIDTAWAQMSGIDTREWLHSYPDRIYACHLRNQSGTLPTEDLLDGDIDIQSFLTTLSTMNYNGWVTLELWHHPEASPKRSYINDVIRSKDFINRILTNQFEKSN